MEMKKCPNCGKSILAFAKTCKYCSYLFETQQVAPPVKHTQENVGTDYVEKNKPPQAVPFVAQQPAYTQTSSYNPQASKSKEDDKLGFLLGAVCLILPIVGIIVCVINIKSSPEKAKSALFCAIAGFLLPIILSPLFN